MDNASSINKRSEVDIGNNIIERHSANISKTVTKQPIIVSSVIGTNKEKYEEEEEEDDDDESSLLIEQQQNKKKSRKGHRKRKKTSSYRGVSFLKGRNVWRARIELGGNPEHLGYFATEIEAAQAYKDRVAKLSKEMNMKLSQLPSSKESSSNSHTSSSSDITDALLPIEQDGNDALGRSKMYGGVKNKSKNDITLIHSNNKHDLSESDNKKSVTHLSIRLGQDIQQHVGDDHGDSKKDINKQSLETEVNETKTMKSNQLQLSPLIDHTSSSCQETSASIEQISMFQGREYEAQQQQQQQQQQHYILSSSSTTQRPTYVNHPFPSNIQQDQHQLLLSSSSGTSHLPSANMTSSPLNQYFVSPPSSWPNTYLHNINIRFDNLINPSLSPAIQIHENAQFQNMLMDLLTPMYTTRSPSPLLSNQISLSIPLGLGSNTATSLSNPISLTNIGIPSLNMTRSANATILQHPIGVISPDIVSSPMIDSNSVLQKRISLPQSSISSPTTPYLAQLDNRSAFQQLPLMTSPQLSTGSNPRSSPMPLPPIFSTSANLSGIASPPLISLKSTDAKQQSRQKHPRS